MKDIWATPSWQSGPVRLADHIELVALHSPRRRLSAGDIIASFDRREDEDEDRFERPVEDAFQELANRIDHLGRAVTLYPFELLSDEIRVRSDSFRENEDWLYLFLLLATALNMRDERKHEGLDGAELFERLSSEVASRYFGGAKDERVRTMVFGTARFHSAQDGGEPDVDSFSAAVNELCAELGE